MLSRFRISTGRVFAAAVLACMFLIEPPRPLAPWLTELGELVGFVMLAVAALGRVWSTIFIAGKKNEVLVMDGPYSVVRNPLYLFSFVGAVGFGLAVENLLLALAITAFFLATYPGVVAREEVRLSDRFGEAYAAYRRATPRWVPDWRLYREPEVLSVCPVKVRKGILDAMWFLWAFLLWEMLEVLRGAGLLPALL